MNSEQRQQLAQVIDTSTNLAHWLRDVQPLRCNANTRDNIPGALFSLAMEHHASIVLLIDTQSPDAAFVLLRAGWDAYVKGLWASRIADDLQLDGFWNDKFVANVDAILLQLEGSREGPLTLASPGSTGGTGTIHEQAWRACCGCRHGGPVPVQRYIPRAENGTHSNEEIIEALQFSNRIGFMALVGMIDCLEVRVLGKLLASKARDLHLRAWI